MARPSKSVATMSKNLTKEEKETRLKVEEKLKGGTNKITPPKHLNKSQKKIFRNIVNELETSGVLGNLDIYILSTCSIALDRIQTIETTINDEPGIIADKDLRMANDKYTKDFFRCCNELSLSPQSRAKIGNIALQTQQEKQDPLLKLLSGGKK
ncbi:phage terminase small subunit P27 family [Tissierella creatinophila]|uniref:Phage terminase, small subunit n=1 Tax=Tissierella creatinophila DSM 6911 TaxID=1123403 RepID=A0A1U7M559_TISCR|nr:phage terminase small subunit P27 family [Tissierella creatinophila]OLS02415.1 phage terminase, small subunit [Tissierella creatinophila DSM 6911]